ncbi:hypothetical protein [Occultella kanbiaonis]|uniref:hypothetical protein n=1 Tax=Occultella kanbiaonis TaxID=2675754 RepID=UPI0013D5D49E|nr:hypothetical protein [Occultella kanbiaonis]
MSDGIEWKTYIEPVRHTRTEVTEANVLDFCREFGWTLSYVEKKCAPYPDGRVTVMKISNVRGAPRGDAEVPFWVSQHYSDDEPRYSNAPPAAWEQVTR